MNNSLREFAERYRLKLKRDPGDGTEIIPGRPEGSHVYEYGEGELGVMLMPDSARRWGNARRAFIAAGMTLRQNGDREGAASFAPTNRSQARLAIKYARVKARRRLSALQHEVLVRARARIGKPSAPEALQGAISSVRASGEGYPAPEGK